MPDFILPDEADRCPNCDRVLYVGVDCECGECPAHDERDDVAEAFDPTADMHPDLMWGADGENEDDE